MLLQEQTQKQQTSNDVSSGTKGEPKPEQQSSKRDKAHKASTPTRQSPAVALKAGIGSALMPQDAVTDVQRAVPADEPGPLGPNEDLKSVGKRVQRIDGPMKTTGRARYTADVY